MGGYTAVSDTGKTLVEFLRKNCVPPVEKPELIGLCSPSDVGNYAVCVSLYDMDEDTTARISRADIMIDETHAQSPPSVLNLHYMIFTALKSDITVRALDEQRILGRVFQSLSDNAVIDTCLQGTLADNFERVNITFENIPYEEKIKVWTAFNLPPKTSLFYKVSGVLVESERIREVKRVVTADITLKQRRRG